MIRTSKFLCISIMAVTYHLTVADPIPNSTTKNDINESIEPLNANWRSMFHAFIEVNNIDPNYLADLQNLINEQKKSHLKLSLQNLYDVAKRTENDYQIFEQLTKTVVEQSSMSASAYDKLLESIENKRSSLEGVFDEFFKSDGILQSVINKQLYIQNLTASELILYLGNILEVILSRNYVIEYTANSFKGNSEKCQELTQTYYGVTSSITNKLKTAYCSTFSDIGSCEQ